MKLLAVPSGEGPDPAQHRGMRGFTGPAPGAGPLEQGAPTDGSRAPATSQKPPARWLHRASGPLPSAGALRAPLLVTVAVTRQGQRRVCTAVLLLGLCCQETVAEKEVYTSNTICRRSNCINPVFPGLEDLEHLSQAPWFCSTLEEARRSMGFCRGAVNYDPALPSQGDVKAIVEKQDSAASTTFVYHLSGMGLEAWDHTRPEESDDDCIKSIWRMVCYTYFPRAPIGCQKQVQTAYMRPCKSSCQNYVHACGVECCDESVQCVFRHTKSLAPGQSITTLGYVAHDGPSTFCTGRGQRSGMPSGLVYALLTLLAFRTEGAGFGQLVGTGVQALQKILWLAPLTMAPLLLQGCDIDVPSHTVGNWRAQPDYLIDFQFVLPGSSPKDALLNSCAVDQLAPVLQCNGRGRCKFWDAENLGSFAAFCQCDRDWADPECGTHRKSQTVAFLLSLVFGFLGADQFYLGFRLWGTIKLLTLGGGGLWWIVDFIRIGSGPVATKHFRLAADLPHWAFVLIVVMFGKVIGFVLAYYTAASFQAKLRKDAMLHAKEEEAYQEVPEQKEIPPFTEKPALRIGEPGMQMKFRTGPGRSYGATEEGGAAARAAAGGCPPDSATQPPVPVRESMQPLVARFTPSTIPGLGPLPIPYRPGEPPPMMPPT